MTEFIKPKRKKSIKKKEPSKISKLLGISYDPCSYPQDNKLTSNTLVGVEVELEGVSEINLSDTFRHYWNVVTDGSLRDGGLEFVFSRPFAGKDLLKALDIFDKEVSKSGISIKTTERTSVHVHIDVRDLSYPQLLRFVCLYAVFEEALFLTSGGEDRKGGIFATSLANAEGYISQLGRYGRDPSKYQVPEIMMNFSKYSACNLAAVRTYGSLEFRNHEGTHDITRILRWINILLLLRKAAVEEEVDIEDIFTNISTSGAEKVFSDVFKEHSDSMLYPDLEFDMFNGLRLAQDIIYSDKLFGGVEFPKAKDLKNNLFSNFYKNRDGERYNRRIDTFLSSVGFKLSVDSPLSGEGVDAPIPRTPSPQRQRLVRDIEHIRFEIDDAGNEGFLNLNG